MTIPNYYKALFTDGYNRIFHSFFHYADRILFSNKCVHLKACGLSAAQATAMKNIALSGVIPICIINPTK